MRKALLSVTAIIFTLCACAQEDSTNIRTIRADNSVKWSANQHNKLDGYIYQNGRVVKVFNGKISILESDVTLTNGTVITASGNYIVKGDTIIMFKEGDQMDFQGKLFPLKCSRIEAYNAGENYYDGYLYRNGKVMEINNHNQMAIDADITLNNGTVIKSNGNYMTKGGIKAMLREGEHMDMSGKLTWKEGQKDDFDPLRKDKNMYLLPDSARK